MESLTVEKKKASMIRSVVSLHCVLLLVGCLVFAFAWRVDYELEVAAERQDNGHKTSLQTSGRGRKVDLVAGDDIASFSFNVRPGGIDCTVRNEGTEPFRLRLKGARLIGPDGVERELYAGGARHRGGGKPPELSSFLERGEETTIFLWPQDWFRGEHDGRPSTWKADSPVDGSPIAEQTPEKARQKAQRLLGQTFEIVLPLERDGSRHIYRFYFTVTDLHPERISWS